MDYGMFTDKSNVIAVVGASKDGEKFGYKVYKTLKDKGFNVFAINPKGGRINGDLIYASLEALPKKPTLAITVVPAGVAYEIVKQCKELGIVRVWMQPGSESPEAISFCRKSGIEVVYKACYITDGLKAGFTA